MAGPTPISVPYQPYDASPSGIPETDSPAGRGPKLDVRANPEDMGSAIGQGLQKFGAEGERAGNDASQLALQYQGMLNETLSTNAETQFITQAGEQDAKFKSLEGLAAVNAAPQHIAALTNMQQQIRQNLPGGAARAFDQLTERQLAFRVNEANLYVAQQIKSADLESAKGQIATSVASGGDLSIANDDKQFNNVLQSIHFGQGRMMQNQGWGDAAGMTQNPDGSHSFTNQDGQSAYDQMTNANVSKAWENRLKSIGDNQNIMAAYQKYKDNYDQIPPAGHVAMDAYFAPKIRDFQSRDISESVLGQHSQNYNQEIYDRNSSPFNIGNVKTQSGAQLGTPSFVHPNTPEDGVVLAANNLRNNYQGMTLQDIGAKWAPSQENNTNDWVKNVSAASGIAPNQVPNLNDPKQLQGLIHGIGVAEKSQQDLANFTPAVLESGVTRALNGEQPATGTPASNGKMTPSIADYYKTNYANILDQSRQQAEQAHPGDIDFAEKTEARVKQRMDGIITQDKLAVEAQQNTILKALNGEMSNGQKPQTVDQMIGISPEVKTAWDSMQINNPKAAELIANKMVGAKEDGKLGSGFSYLQQEALQGKLNQNDLLYHVGDDLSQQGFDKLKSMIKAVPSPEERSENDQLATFLKYGHERILHSSLFQNTPEAEDSYQSWFSSVDKAIKDGQAKKIPMQSMLDPTSKDYVGANIKQFTIPVQKQLEDRATRINERLQTGTTGNVEQRQPNETPEQYLARQ